MLVIDTLSIAFHKKKTILDPLSFSLASSACLGIAGPSGCGKTTLVKTILGLFPDRISIKGTIWLDGNLMQKDHKLIIPLHQRGFAYVPQDLALWPHLSVTDTLKLAARFAKTHEEDFFINACGLTQLIKQKPEALSGGEKQRLALARALITKPRLLVLDEPFSALDRKAKEKLVTLVKTLQSELKFSLILISHDEAEIKALADEVLELQ